MISPRFLNAVDGVTFNALSWMVSWCCSDRVAGKMSSSVLAMLSSLHSCRYIRQTVWDSCSYQGVIWMKWEMKLSFISTAMVSEAMCLHYGTQWCGVYIEEQRPKKWSLWNPGDNWGLFGYLTPPTYLWDLNQENKVPVMPNDKTVDKNLMVNCVKGCRKF